MKNIEEINKLKVNEIIAQKKHPEFFPGDIVKVGVKITEGKRDRIQYFEGVCIAKKNRDINSSFTVRKISFGEGVERTFALYSPAVSTIKIIRSGKVRRAKLYYLRDRTGKSARISEKIKKKIGIDLETKVQEVTEENLASPVNENSDNDSKTTEPKNIHKICFCTLENITPKNSVLKFPADSKINKEIIDRNETVIKIGILIEKF